MLGQAGYAERRATNLRRDAQKEAGDDVQRNDDLGDIEVFARSSFRTRTRSEWTKSPNLLCMVSSSVIRS